MKSRLVDVVGYCVVTIAGSSVTAIEVVKVEPCFVDFVISSVVVVETIFGLEVVPWVVVAKTHCLNQ